jgi:hypothetical protein
MKSFIAIEKFGMFYCPYTLGTCPMNTDGTPDTNGVIHLDDFDCEEEQAIRDEIYKVMMDLLDNINIT